MDGSIGMPQVCPVMSSNDTGVVKDLKGLDGGGNSSNSECCTSLARGADWHTLKKACGASTAPNSPRESSSLAAPIGVIPSTCAVEDMEAEHRQASLSSSFAAALLSKSVSIPTALSTSGIDDLCKETSSSLNEDSGAATTPPVEETDSLSVSSESHAAAFLRGGTFVAEKAWDSARIAASAAASATVSAVAATDFFALTEVTTKPLMAAAGYVGLGVVGASSAAKDRTQDGGATVDAVPEDSVSAAGASRTAAYVVSGDVGVMQGDDAVGSVGWLLRRLRMPEASQWFCSQSGNLDMPLGCAAPPVDIDTELQGREAEDAATAHRARVAAAGAATSGAIGGQQVQEAQRMDLHAVVNNYSSNERGPKSEAALGGSRRGDDLKLTSAGPRGACTAHASVSEEPCGAGSKVKNELGGYVAGEEQVLPREGNSELRMLEGLAEQAAEPSRCSSSASQHPRDAVAPKSDDAQPLSLQQQLRSPEGVTRAVFAAEEARPSHEHEEGDVGSDCAEIATAAAQAQQGTQHKNHTVWASMRSRLAETSRRSIQAVQRAAGTAVCAAVVADRALDALVAPLLGACRTPTTHLPESNDSLISEGGPRQRLQGEGDILEEVQSAVNSNEEDLQTATEVMNAEQSSVGLLGELHRHQTSLSQELRNRSTNLLQHSVALSSSASLSEARYHLAEIVDTTGPEVSGVWAGFKVGLGIVTLASGHLLLGGAMVAVATGSLGSAVFWGRHRQEVYEMMRGEFQGDTEHCEATESLAESKEGNSRSAGPSDGTTVAPQSSRSTVSPCQPSRLEAPPAEEEATTIVSQGDNEGS